jgi:metal-responsive CopG/Arc/MetJ family transcriptional regulator
MTKRLNITIPESIAKKMERIPNKSKFIAEAVEEKLKKIEEEKLDKELIEGYKATREEGKVINQEWEKITLEGMEK